MKPDVYYGIISNRGQTVAENIRLVIKPRGPIWNTFKPEANKMEYKNQT